MQLQREFHLIVESELKDSADGLVVKSSSNWDKLSTKVARLCTIESDRNPSFKTKLEEFTSGATGMLFVYVHWVLVYMVFVLCMCVRACACARAHVCVCVCVYCCWCLYHHSLC